MRALLLSILILLCSVVYAVNIDNEIDTISKLKTACQKNTYSDELENKGNNATANEEIAKYFVLSFYLTPEKYDLRCFLDYVRFDHSSIEQLSKENDFDKNREKIKQVLIENIEKLTGKLYLAK